MASDTADTTADSVSAPSAGWSTDVPNTQTAAFEDVRTRLVGIVDADGGTALLVAAGRGPVEGVRA
ncbi:MAG: hypothetical protein ABWY33_06825 [Cellulomonas sp.]